MKISKSQLCQLILEEMKHVPSAEEKTRNGSELPGDYEECGDCGYDHGYDYPEAAAWHKKNPGSYAGSPGVNEAQITENTTNDLHEVIDVVASSLAHQVVSNALENQYCAENVCEMVFGTLQNDDFMRPARLEDVEHYATQITDLTLKYIHDEVHRTASQALRMLMENQNPDDDFHSND
jgi:hypothetical protein